MWCCPNSLTNPFFLKEKLGVKLFPNAYLSQKVLCLNDIIQHLESLIWGKY